MSTFDTKICRKRTKSIKYEWAMKMAGEDVIPLWIADMDFAISPIIEEALKKRLDHPIFGYQQVEEDIFDNMIAWFKQRHHYYLKKEDLILTVGVLPSLSLAIRMLSEKGDKVIIPTPAYQPFITKTTINERIPLTTAMKLVNHRYTIDFDDLEKQMDETVKLFILCNPHNPSGTLYTKEELQEIVDFCKKHQLYIISDEIHCDFIGKDQQFYPIMDIDEYSRSHTIALTSVGKTFNLAGIKIATVIIKDPKLHEAYAKAVKQIGLDEINIFAYEAYKAAYSFENSQWFDQELAYIQANKAFVKEYIKEHMPKVYVNDSQSTYLLWLNFNPLKIDDIHSILLKEAKVMFVRGNFFGEEYDGYERINLASPRECLQEAMHRISKVLKKYNNI